MKKISVIVPVYKAEKWLARCVDSILSQTYRNIELILIDDGSTDKSGEICDLYAGKDHRVRVVHQPNKGVAAARNAGIELATGEYCTFVDSDDHIDSIMYEYMMDKAINYDCDIVMCDCIKEYGEKIEVYTHDIRSGYYDRKQIEKEYFPNLLMMPNVEYPPTISNCLCLFKLYKEKYDKNGGATKKIQIRYEEGIRFSEDLLFGAELMYQAESFFYMKGEALYHYWMNEDSASHTFKADKWMDYIKLHNKIEEKFQSEKKYDFTYQIQLVLLFFTYNAVGDIISTDQLDDKEKLQKCRDILNDIKVRKMFKKLNIWELQVSIKLKLKTILYKYKMGLKFLISRERRK